MLGNMLEFKILKLHYNPPDVFNLGYENVFLKVNKITFLNTLMQNLDNFLFIVEIDWLDKPDNEFVKQHIFVKDSVELILSKNRSICLINSKLPEVQTDIILHLSRNFNCFMEFPIVMDKDGIVGSIVGPHKDLIRFLDFLESWGAKLEIISIRKYYPKGYGVLSALTSQQLKCLEFAVENGFFNFPKQNDSRTIAKKLGISHPTFIEHIKKAEKLIFSNLLKI